MRGETLVRLPRMRRRLSLLSASYGLPLRWGVTQQRAHQIITGDPWLSARVYRVEIGGGRVVLILDEVDVRRFEARTGRTPVPPSGDAAPGVD
jgi:hypothetical protein